MAVAVLARTGSTRVSSLAPLSDVVGLFDRFRSVRRQKRSSRRTIASKSLSKGSPLSNSFSLRPQTVTTFNVGGRGNAGGLTHLKSNFDRFHPGYFGKVGMRNFHVRKNSLSNYCPTINVEKLWTLVQEDLRLRLKEDDKKRAPVIDCTKSGFFKVLGKGRLPNQPVIVKARFFSRHAERKIKEVGGACILTA